MLSAARNIQDGALRSRSAAGRSSAVRRECWDASPAMRETGGSSGRRIARKRDRNCRKADERGSAGLDGTSAARGRGFLQSNRITRPRELANYRRSDTARITYDHSMHRPRRSTPRGNSESKAQKHTHQKEKRHAEACRQILKTLERLISYFFAYQSALTGV